jgi:glycosyltransferase involved in cell wall biosynthesis
MVVIPLISVIIPTYNREDVILRAVLSVLEQEDTVFELIVVDDGSTDDTYNVLLPLTEDTKSMKDTKTANNTKETGDIKDTKEIKTRKYIKYIKTANKGVSAARNKGIEISQGEYIAFLDSDDQYLPGKLKAQESFMEKNKNFLFSQCQERWIRNGKRVNPKQKHLKRIGLIFLDSLNLSLISPSAVIMRREFFNLMGLFDEELLACEDYDLWLRALIHYPVGLLDKELVIRHSGRDDQLSKRHSLDKYRIKTLTKLLMREDLPPEYRKESEKVLSQKKSIYEGGLKKREDNKE